MLDRLKAMLLNNVKQIRYLLITLSIVFLIVALADWDDSGKAMVTTSLVLNIMLVAIPLFIQNVLNGNPNALWG